MSWRFLHILTTSRYTRHLEAENAELRKRIALLEAALIPRVALLEAQQEDRKTQAAERKNPPAPVAVTMCHECGMTYTGMSCPQCGAVASIRKDSPRSRFRSFSAIKRELENAEVRKQ